jgi:hypothetical protein
VAVGTLYHIPVAARQFKARGDVVEGRWLPCRGGVARLAIFGDPRVNVARDLRRVVIGQVAAVTGCWCAGEPAGVTT